MQIEEGSGQIGQMVVAGRYVDPWYELKMPLNPFMTLKWAS